jgi:hypothetical protein
VNVVQLDVKCFHLAAKIVNIFPRFVTLWEWCYAHKCQLGCSLDNAVCGVKVTPRLAGEDGPYMAG